MGCGFSRSDGQLLTLAPPSSIPTSPGMRAFEALEEADEKVSHGEHTVLATSILNGMEVEGARISSLTAIKPAAVGASR